MIYYLGRHNMKKILSILMVHILVLSGLGAVAINGDNTSNAHLEISTEIMKIDFPSPTLVESNNDYVKLRFVDDELYLMNPGQPMLPRVLKSIELPFGARNVKVEVIPRGISESTISKEILPAPAPVPLSPNVDFVAPPKKDITVYTSDALYPSSWYNYNVGCGLNANGEHVTHLTINIYPVRYAPATGKICVAEKADVIITFDDPEGDIFPQTSEYDLVIIAPSSFSSALQRLVDHKNSYDMKTLLKSTEEIYNEYTGVDKPEQIKYFIKDAIETWGINYVLLVGGLKSTIYAKPKDNMNVGEKGWHVPVRYSNMRAGGDAGYPVDLYYADIYKLEGEFESWDYDGDGVFAEWPDDYGESRDISDLLPDVAVGRLACSDVEEVSDVVNKIITYETSTYGSDWFKKMVVYSGDGFLDQFDLNIQWDTKELADGAYTINAQSFNPEGDQGPVDTIHITLDSTVASEVTFNHDDHLNPILQNGYPAPPIAEIVSISEGNILGNTDVAFEPSEGYAYCNTLFWWANVSYVDGVLTIRGKSYDPKPYGNLSSIHVWVENDQEAVVFSDWRNDTPTYYEGEWVTGEEAVNGRGGALYYMPEEFDKEIIWCSNGKFNGPDDVMNSFSEGYGFAFFSGHGSPGYWGDQYPGIPGNRQYGSVDGLVVSNLRSYPPFITDRPIWPMDELSNTGKLPITVVGGCHNSLFNVSLIPSAIHYYTALLGRNNWMWTGIQLVPQCWSWYMVQLPNTGAIATMGNAGLGWGWEGEFCTVGAGDGWISSEFFRQYGDHFGQEKYDILGHVYQQTQTSYINQFKDFTLPESECWWYPDFGWDAIDQQAVEQWVLLGDPSLKIGGYQ